MVVVKGTKRNERTIDAKRSSAAAAASIRVDFRAMLLQLLERNVNSVSVMKLAITPADAS